MIPPDQVATTRALFAAIAQETDHHRAEIVRLAQLRADLAATLRVHGGLTNDELGQVLNVAGARAGELARRGNPSRFVQ